MSRLAITATTPRTADWPVGFGSQLLILLQMRGLQKHYTVHYYLYKYECDDCTRRQDLQTNVHPRLPPLSSCVSLRLVRQTQKDLGVPTRSYPASIGCFTFTDLSRQADGLL
ncbi:hypothetical protein Cob_v000816 [Colletotrichum orbiculare MAFF 240422]|uniref:Uncharacterized protein n=1 Tax=Colletotrichum orbiculare (strain 104-T / ATCC 96160 / CBS 514.97 / LARS 414 / MAFF 240422) TaxID=1213857 RepID=A0A484GA23_COLOR|nr:hypothetical protein Cob_v000816 [Colletotrichum orbiculare MAFF 240422]